MIGWARLENIQTLAENVFRDRVEGDFLEAGVWRSGATIFMRGLLKAYNVDDRSVWVADSFCGFPKPEEMSSRSYTSPEVQTLRQSIETGDPVYKDVMKALGKGTTLEEVKRHFEQYGLLDEQVQFLPGFFSETLSSGAVKNLAILRADGDLYDSTYQILENLYPRVSPGGYVIIDDYHSFIECRQAVHDYLDKISTNVHLERIDEDAVFWRKENR